MRTNSQIKARTDAPWPHTQGKKMIFQVFAGRSKKKLQTFQHCPGPLPWWPRVDWLSCKTLQAISRVL